MLKNRVPPVVLVLLWFVGIYLLHRHTALLTIELPRRIEVAVIFGLFGLVIIAAGVWEFSKHQTTVDPTQPEKASRLVDTGIFRVTRNPMYLGMSLIVLAWLSYFLSVSGVMFAVCFMLYLNWFQIKPEEQAMAKLFPEQWPEYQQRVRRWI